MRTGTSGYWVAFSVLIAATCLMHTTGLIFGVIAWTWALWSPSGRHVVRPLLLSSLAAGLACAPFFVAIVRALANGSFHSAPRSLTGLELAYTLLTYVAGFAFGPAPREIQNFGALAALRSHRWCLPSCTTSQVA